MCSFASVKVVEKIKFNQSVVALGQHLGKLDLSGRHFSAEEHAILEALSPRKQSEWVASRDLLYIVADLPNRPQCLYDDLGKPYLSGVDQTYFHQP